eukprot:scaffold77_cov116-Isochrysis_galbana.AAC.1
MARCPCHPRASWRTRPRREHAAQHEEVAQVVDTEAHLETVLRLAALLLYPKADTGVGHQKGQARCPDRTIVHSAHGVCKGAHRRETGQVQLLEPDPCARVGRLDVLLRGATARLGPARENHAETVGLAGQHLSSAETNRRRIRTGDNGISHHVLPPPVRVCVHRFRTSLASVKHAQCGATLY